MEVRDPQAAQRPALERRRGTLLYEAVVLAHQPVGQVQGHAHVEVRNLSDVQAQQPRPAAVGETDHGGAGTGQRALADRAGRPGAMAMTPRAAQAASTSATVPSQVSVRHGAGVEPWL